MNFDERIAKLTERHEALAQSVELLLHVTEKHTEQIKAHTEQIAGLVRLAEIQHERLTRLEDQQ